MATTLTSYDTGSKPFKPDISRGKWESINDFYAVLFSLTFGLNFFSMLPMHAVTSFGIFFIIPYIIGLSVFTIPIFFIQSFMGQFSSSGFISAYRIAPLFKGIGYTLVVVNLIALCYSVGVTSHTLVYFLASFSPELPWMSCNNSWNTHNCTVEQIYYENHTNFMDESWSSWEYLIHGVDQLPQENKIEYLSISWRLLTCTIIIWVLIPLVVLQGVEFIGKLLRYFCYIILGGILILFIRILFVENAFHLILEFLTPTLMPRQYIEGTFYSIVLPILVFGCGSGTIMTVTSYNNFHSDIRIYSWVNAIILLTVSIITGLWSGIVQEYLIEHYNFRAHYYEANDFYYPLIGIPFFLGKLSFSNFWSLLFFGIIFLGEFSGTVIYMLSIVTGIFDEFEYLRTYKQGIIMVLSGILFLITLGFTVNDGTLLIAPLTNASEGTYCIICFINIMIVVWFYGRERFQRDVQFLLQGKMYKTWEFMILRFLTPILILFVTSFYVLFYFYDMYYHVHFMFLFIFSIFVKLMPFCLIVGWIIYKMKMSTGSIWTRFKNLCIPTDWYPVDPGDRRRYEDVLGASNADNFRDLCTNIDIQEFDGD